MEPIFNDQKFNSNKNIVDDCSLLVLGTEYFFSHLKNRTLENACYHFGLMFDSLHLNRNSNSYKKILKPLNQYYFRKIDIDFLVEVQSGKNKKFEYDEKEADKFDPYYWKIKMAIKYQRQDWAYFMFLGNIHGLLNGDRITKDKFIAYFKLFPKHFIKDYTSQLLYTLNFFDERGYFFSFNGELILEKKGNDLYLNN